MADPKDTKFQQPVANSERRGLENTDPTRQEFNQSGQFQEGYDKASPEAKARIREQNQTRTERLETLTLNHQRYRDANIVEERARLYDEHFKQPQPIPNDPQARATMQKTIEDQAVANVDRRHEWNLKNIERTTDGNIREILRRDQHAQKGHDHTAPGHDHER